MSRSVEYPVVIEVEEPAGGMMGRREVKLSCRGLPLISELVYDTDYRTGESSERVALGNFIISLSSKLDRVMNPDDY